MRLLVAEDNSALASFLQKGLEEEHYAVDVAGDGEEAEFMAENYEYDLLILDLSLPRRDGLAVLQSVRNRKAAMPVLILSGRAEVQDRVKGLDLGADDFLPKPFSFTELSARVRALLRRSSPSRESVLRVKDLELNRLEHAVRRAGRRIELTSREFALLEYLMQNAGRPVTRTMIIENVWNLSLDTMTNVVDVYINYLRKKVDDGFQAKLIRTVRGVGYQIGLLQEDSPEHHLAS